MRSRLKKGRKDFRKGSLGSEEKKKKKGYKREKLCIVPMDDKSLLGKTKGGQKPEHSTGGRRGISAGKREKKRFPTTREGNIAKEGKKNIFCPRELIGLERRVCALARIQGG